jgi:type IV pilus assembly protein PilA
MEMMVIIAIIAILATLALPSYQGRLVRKQIEMALPLADIAKAPIAAAWALTQTFPADNAAAGLPVADKIVSNFVSAVTVQDGVINITFGNSAHPLLRDKILTLRPAVVTDAPVVPVAWVCNKAQVPDKMTVRGINQSTVADTYMPLGCRFIPR